MRTSTDVFHRFQWDADLSEHRVFMTVHHMDRVRDAVVTTPLQDWLPVSAGGDIPWHRVVAFSHDGLGIVWDRRSGIDHVFSPPHPNFFPTLSHAAYDDDVPPSFPIHSVLLAAGARPFPPLSYSPVNHDWLPYPGHKGPYWTTAPTTLRVAFWNICVDTYDTDCVPHRERLRRIVRFLRTLSPSIDVIALAEVTSSFCEELVAEPFVRACFLIPFHPQRDSTSLTPYGVFMLVRRRQSFHHPHFYGLHLASSKHALFLSLCQSVSASPSSPPVPLLLSSFHLTSDRQSYALLKRRTQITRLSAILRHPLLLRPPVLQVALADVNARNDDHLLRPLAMRDVWTHLCPTNPGHTFTPASNALAFLASPSGLPARLDRILCSVRGHPQVSLVPDQVSLFAEHSIPTLDHPTLLSDHAGLRAIFSLRPPDSENLSDPSPAPTVPLPVPAHQPSSDRPPSYRSAVAVVPAIHHWPPIQEIRRAHDPAFPRWMPHINLLFPFLHSPDDRSLDELTHTLHRVLQKIPSFQVTCSSIGSFQHKSSTTFFAQPDEVSSIHLGQLHTALSHAFPQCVRHDTYRPHLTVAKSRSFDTPPAQVSQCVPFSFPIEAVCLLQRDDASNADFFTVQSVIPLCSTSAPVSWSMFSEAGALKSLDAAIRQAVDDRACSSASASASASLASVRLVGSRALNLALTDHSDIDVLLVVSEASDKLLQRIIKNLRTGMVAEAAYVWEMGTEEVLIRSTMFGRDGKPGLGIDVMVSWGGRLGANAVSDVGYFRKFMDAMDVGERGLFRNLIVGFVKPWIRARGLVGGNTGHLPSIAWLILAFGFWKGGVDKAMDFWGVCKQFVEYVRAIDWAGGVVLDLLSDVRKAAIGGKDDAVMRILSPGTRKDNVARKVTHTGFKRLCLEMERCLQLETVDQAIESRLLPGEETTDDDHAVIVAVGVQRRNLILEAEGWLHGRAGNIVEIVDDVCETHSAEIYSEILECDAESLMSNFQAKECHAYRYLCVVIDVKEQEKFVEEDFAKLEEKMKSRLDGMLRSDAARLDKESGSCRFSITSFHKPLLLLRKWLLSHRSGRFL